MPNDWELIAAVTLFLFLVTCSPNHRNWSEQGLYRALCVEEKQCQN